MIAGIFHEGSGLGDQLFRYITVRTLAEEKGYEWGIIRPENFKGDSFMKLDTGLPILGTDKGYQLRVANHIIFDEKTIIENGTDIRSFDPEIQFINDNTIIDGSFEDSKYWHHNLANISKWLAVEPEDIPDDICVVGFRGGEYAMQPDLFLDKNYYDEATAKIRPFYPLIDFVVHTDDPDLAKKFFPEDFQITPNSPISHSKHSNMALNWRSARYAKYAIIPNSAFFIIPRLLKHLEDPTAVTIAPRYWARRNTKTWARPACYYKEFTYI